MKFISLFAGIGGFDLGFEWAGMECVAQVEKDPFCLRVLEKHWPNVQRFEDVREFGKHNAPPADLICGGFPCQPHSLAGKRKGAADDRDLWPEYRRIVAELQPRWVVGENVLGIRTTILDEVLSDLESLDYSTVSFVIPACAFNAPHRRDRIFVAAYSAGNRRNYKRTTWERRQNNKEGEYFPKSEQAGTRFRIEVEQLRLSIPDTNGSRIQKFTRAQLGGVREQEESFSRSSAGGTYSARDGRNWWSVEPAVGRVANGVPGRVDRLRSLGNAVVPQVAEFIARSILRAESNPNTACTKTSLSAGGNVGENLKSTRASNGSGNNPAGL